jgi:hypothetical protein
MRNNKFFAAALAATLLAAACSKESDNTTTTGDGNETYAGVNITIPAEALGVRGEDSAAGIAAEKTITTIGVYIIDAETGRFDYEVYPTSSFNLTGQTYTMQAGIKTVTGSKKLFVVANPETAVGGGSALVSKLATMRGTALNAVGMGLPVSNYYYTTGTTLNSMVLSGGITTAFTLGLQTDDDTAGTGALDPANVKAVTLERNLAKVVLRQASSMPVTGGTTTLSWLLRGEAKDAFLIPQPSLSSLYAAVPADATVSPAGDTHAYWNNFTKVTTTGITATEFIPVLAATASTAGTQATFAQSKYCFENYQTDRYAGNTTTAIIKGVFIPTDVVTAFTAGAPVVTAGGPVDVDGSFWLNKKNNSYWTTVAKEAAVGADAANYPATDFVKYTGGVGYYTLYVQDNAGDVGVKRNRYYLLTINKVLGPGRPSVDVDPNNPLEKDTYLAISATVRHWDLQQSAHSLE